MKEPIRAVYRLREDGDYEFMAAFANDGEIWDGDVAETYAENLRFEGEEVLVKNFDDLKHLVDVLTVGDVRTAARLTAATEGKV